jgi:hypothetical protein
MPSEKPIVWAAAIAVLIVAAGLYYYYYSHTHEAQPAATIAKPLKLPPPPSEPEIQNPVPPPPAAATGQALPALNESDSAFHDALTGVPGAAAVEKFVIPQNLIRHIVVTVDNLPRKKVPVDMRPLKSTPGQVITVPNGDRLTLGDKDYGRYAPFVDVVKSTDMKQLAATYFHFYPLFQQAYEDLGYPSGYFNDRVIEAIDDLLKTPDLKSAPELVQPNVMYQYADPKLETLSAGQKTLLRMGPNNEAIIKGKLQELRALLATHKR